MTSRADPDGEGGSQPEPQVVFRDVKDNSGVVIGSLTGSNTVIGLRLTEWAHSYTSAKQVVGQIIAATVNVGNVVADRLISFASKVKEAAIQLEGMAKQIQSTTDVLRNILTLYATTEEQGMDLSSTNTEAIRNLERNIESCRETIEGAGKELNTFMEDVPAETTSRPRGNEGFDLDEVALAKLLGRISQVRLEITQGKLNLEIQLQVCSMVLSKTYVARPYLPMKK